MSLLLGPHSICFQFRRRFKYDKLRSFDDGAQGSPLRKYISKYQTIIWQLSQKLQKLEKLHIFSNNYSTYFCTLFFFGVLFCMAHILWLPIHISKIYNIFYGEHRGNSIFPPSESKFCCFFFTHTFFVPGAVDTCISQNNLQPCTLTHHARYTGSVSSGKIPGRHSFTRTVEIT